MVDNDIVKEGLVQIHALCSEVELLAGKVLSHKNNSEGLSSGEPYRQHAVSKSIEKAEKALEFISKAIVLANCLCSLLEDRKEKNAVIQNALKSLSEGYYHLLRIQDALQSMSSG